MPKFTIISDPNRLMGGSEDFRVHREGCGDIAKHKRHPKFSLAATAYTVEATTAEEAVKKEVAVLQDQEQDYGESDFRICNCCKSK